MSRREGAAPGVRSRTLGALRLSLRTLGRDARAGELWVLAFALIIAVASVTAVGFFTDRVRIAIVHQANELLAADLLVQASGPMDPGWRAHAEALGLSTGLTATFPSVVVAGEAMHLADVKAVSDEYPLRGALRAAPAPYAQDETVAGGPAPGTVWAEAELLRELGIGTQTTVGLGAAHPRLDKVLTFEPDRGGKIFAVAPRLMMNLADLPATELVQPGSRVQYQLLVAGSPAQVAEFRGWIESRLPPGYAVMGVHDARPELRRALDGAQQFLGLAALVSALLAGVGIAMATRRHVQRHTDGVALMRCLGARQGLVVRVFALELLWVGLLASALGCLLGFGAQYGLTGILGDLLPEGLPGASWRPAAAGLLTGLILVMGFGLPPVMRLRDIPPARVLRRDLGGPAPRAWPLYAAALGAVTGLMLWQAGELRLTLMVLGGALLTLSVLALVGFALLRLLGSVRHGVGVTWRFGLNSIVRRSRGSVAQVAAFGLGIMVLLLLSLVRGDLLGAWVASVPEGSPNRFLINIQAHEVAEIESLLAERGRPDVGLYPIVRGRLVAVNDRRIDPNDYTQERTRRVVERDFHLSWAADPRSDNRIVAGRWWTAAEHDAPLLSVEEGLAEQLDIALGDELRFWVAGEEFVATVASLREVDWVSFKPNFFVMAPPQLLADYPVTYITSFYLPAEEASVLAELVARFPSATVLDVDAIMTRVRDIVGSASQAVQYVFLFTLLAGLAVLFAAIQATQNERRQEGALLRTLGASRRQLQVGTLSEFVTLGVVAGLVGALAASLIGYVVAEHVFEIGYRFNPWVWLIGLLGGGLGVGLAGYLGTRTILARPPLEVLRREA
jgi:putative ABC transport system permease protein